MDFSLIPVPLLFVISVIAAIGLNTLKVWYIKRENPLASEMYMINGGLSIVTLLLLFVFAGFSITVSVYTLICALLFGLFVTISGVVNNFALKIGPYSYTQTIISLSTIITALSGWVFWGESLSVFKIIGLFFILACFFLAVDKSKDKNSANVKWFILCMVCLVSSAAIGLTQKVHQSSDFRAEIYGFLIITFIISTIVSFVFGFLVRRKEIKTLDRTAKQKINWKFLIFTCVVCGVGTAFNHGINLFLAGAVESAIMFPIVNGVPFVSAVALSFLLFKERLSKKQTVGLIVGIIAMLCLCLG